VVLLTDSVSQISLDLPLWRLELIAAISLVGSCLFFALGVREVFRGRIDKPADDEGDRTR
jgi:hypothetical protein